MNQRTYSELCQYATFEDRFHYLQLHGAVGHDTFGFDRYAYADKLLAGRGGVGIYPPGLGRANGWVHVDVRKEKSRWRG